jgi:hypothetical protein
MDNKSVLSEPVLAAYSGKTIKRMANHDVVPSIQDTSRTVYGSPPRNLLVNSPKRAE